jgi:hypothetical protein
MGMLTRANQVHYSTSSRRPGVQSQYRSVFEAIQVQSLSVFEATQVQVQSLSVFEATQVQSLFVFIALRSGLPAGVETYLGLRLTLSPDLYGRCARTYTAVTLSPNLYGRDAELEPIC